ncbi:DUF2147 domain-containing protein [Chitinophaga filiformis]|uniref:Lipocalin-like domain-containing protein n=1 Tax=Chitinophaga filiformis TaxID=104663 RepID=A0A1G7WNG4_CHIFI|nr:DUF2147 domain-containing protein [Chitinophaga filiformis]SDG73408.1 hypothetical protein SAMN04488121_10678 [Chitinophaga filiformis]
MAQSIIRTSIFSACFFAGTPAFCQIKVNITGNWKIEAKDKPAEIEIYPAKDDAYYGKIINDNNVPSKNGTIVLKALKYDKADQAFKGTMRPPDADVDLNVTVSPVDKDRLKMTARKLLVSKTIYLTRIK